MTDAQPGEHIDDMSVGELVAMASSSASQLLRSEIELAKTELKDDAKKAALGGVLFGLAGLIGGLVLIMLSMTLAYGIAALLDWPQWAAFLTVSLVYLLLGGVMILIGVLRLKRIGGAKRTRKTLKDDLSILRRSGRTPEPPAIKG